MRDDYLITDIHTHVLPAVDDGPANLAQSAELLSMFYSSGVDRVICTSHYGSPHFAVTKSQIEEAFTVVTSPDTLSVDCPTLHMGAEVRVSSQIRDEIAQSTLPVFGGSSYILIEFPGSEVSAESLEMVYELVIRGLKPVIAHPERNVAIQKDNQILEELLELGALLQLTADCFIRRRSQMHMTEKLAWSILKNGRASLIASDAHNITTRPPVLVQAYKAIESELGSQVVDALIQNANAVWDGAPCSEVATKPGKRKFHLFT